MKCLIIFPVMEAKPVNRFKLPNPFMVVMCILLLTTQLISEPNEYEQPIAFSHKTHAETSAIACEFCHVYADRSQVAGIPSLSSCLGCHRLIKGSTEEQQRELEKLDYFGLMKQPINWKKIHDLPDFVYFSHQSHVNIGVECEVCHGDIASIEVITLENMNSDLSMGWCLNCHKQPLTDGKYTEAKSVDAPTYSKKAKIKYPSMDCYSCHK